MEKKINLEEILDKHLARKASLEVDNDDYVFIKRAMKEAIKQALELAAENAKVDYRFIMTGGSPEHYAVVDKESITDTINKIN